MLTNQRLWMQVRLQPSRCRELRIAWTQLGELRPNLRLKHPCSPLSILVPSQEPLVPMEPRKEYLLQAMTSLSNMLSALWTRSKTSRTTIWKEPGRTRSKSLSLTMCGIHRTLSLMTRSSMASAIRPLTGSVSRAGSMKCKKDAVGWSSISTRRKESWTSLSLVSRTQFKRNRRLLRNSAPFNWRTCCAPQPKMWHKKWSAVWSHLRVALVS